MRSRRAVVIVACLSASLLAAGCSGTGSPAAGSTGAASSAAASASPTERELTGTELAAGLPPLSAYGAGLVESQGDPANSGDALNPQRNISVTQQSCWQLVHGNIGSISDSYAVDAVHESTDTAANGHLLVAVGLTQFPSGTGSGTFDEYTTALAGCPSYSVTPSTGPAKGATDSGTIATAHVTGLGDKALRTDYTESYKLNPPSAGTPLADYSRTLDVLYGDVEIEITATSYSRTVSENYDLTGLVKLIATKLKLS